MKASISRTNIILITILAAQLIAGVVIFFPDTSSEETSSGPLLAGFDASSVQSIAVRDAQDRVVVVARGEGDTWVLPEKGDFPVQTSRITTLLTDIGALEANRLIAQNTSSHSRLKVAENDYERLVEITYADNHTDRLYVGTAGGGNATHMRLNDSSQVYLTSGLSSWEIPTQLSSWIDTLYFSAPQDQIAYIKVENANGTFELQKRDDAWTLIGLQGGETLDTAGVDRVVRQSASLRMTQPVGKESEDRFGMDSPLATVTITTREEVQPEAEATPEVTPEASINVSPLAIPESTPEPEVIETTYTVLIGAQLEGGTDYVVKASGSEFYVQISASAAETFVNLSRADLLVEPEVTPEATAESTPEVSGGN